MRYLCKSVTDNGDGTSSFLLSPVTEVNEAEARHNIMVPDDKNVADNTLIMSNTNPVGIKAGQTFSVTFSLDN